MASDFPERAYNQFVAQEMRRRGAGRVSLHAAIALTYLINVEHGRRFDGDVDEDGWFLLDVATFELHTGMSQQESKATLSFLKSTGFLNRKTYTNRKEWVRLDDASYASISDGAAKIADFMLGYSDEE